MNRDTELVETQKELTNLLVTYRNLVIQELKERIKVRLHVEEVVVEISGTSKLNEYSLTVLIKDKTYYEFISINKNCLSEIYRIVQSILSKSL